MFLCQSKFPCVNNLYIIFQYIWPSLLYYHRLALHWNQYPDSLRVSSFNLIPEIIDNCFPQLIFSSRMRLSKNSDIDKNILRHPPPPHTHTHTASPLYRRFKTQDFQKISFLNHCHQLRDKPLNNIIGILKFKFNTNKTITLRNVG